MNWKGWYNVKVEQVIRLLDAGYTRDEITAMETGEALPEVKQTEQENPIPENPIPENPEASETKTTDTDSDVLSKRLDSIEESIQKMIKTVQTNNLKHDSFSGLESLEDKTDDIMKSIIRPERKEGK
jgi:hypothetical protein